MMPKPIRKKRPPRFPRARRDEEFGELTVRELADEVESIRASLWAVGERLNKLSWVLMTRGVNPGTAQETSDDSPF